MEVLKVLLLLAYAVDNVAFGAYQKKMFENKMRSRSVVRLPPVNHSCAPLPLIKYIISIQVSFT